MVSEFKDLTAEAIYDALAKMIDSKPVNNPYVYNHADMHVAIAAGREHERERILRLIDTDFWHHRIWGNDKPTCLPDCPMCETIWLINDVNIL